MELTHRSYERGQTVAAVATPHGVGGVAVIRISGGRALSVADRIFSGPVRTYRTHTVHFGKILDARGDMIDEGMALVMKAPKSYTGEDTVEIHCHGGMVITRRVLHSAFAAGALPALPGEFTLKAFQNGKIDLTRAEAVQEVISSKGELACQAAQRHLDGGLHNKIRSFQRQLVDIASTLEAWIDFPEEDIEDISQNGPLTAVKNLIEEMSALHRSFHDGKILQATLSLCLIGAPNVGKSSLMNAIIGKESSIVTHIPGTTRDVLKEEIQLAGLTFHLFDTAGIRKTQELIEQEGVARSYEAAREADLILLVLDVTNPTQQLPPNLPKKQTIAVWNKIDLHHPPVPKLPFRHQVHISAKEGFGLDTLKSEIHHAIWRGDPPSKEELFLTNERHYHALGVAIPPLFRVVEGLQNELSPELLIPDIQLSLRELGTIIGINITEEVLHAIFSKFCIGK